MYQIKKRLTGGSEKAGKGSLSRLLDKLEYEAIQKNGPPRRLRSLGIRPKQ